jgi:uroporphyrinogen-III decarboxylase
MEDMTSRERVLAALNLEEPDRVPWVEEWFDYRVAEKILEQIGGPAIDWELNRNNPEISVPPEIAGATALDNLAFELVPPFFSVTRPGEDMDVIVDGLIKSEDDLRMLDQLPDPDDEQIYRRTEQFVKRYKADFAMIATIRTGISNTYLSMGIIDFCSALLDNVELVQAIYERFSNWCARAARNISEMDFDLIQVNDDLAFKTGPFFSPDVFRELFLPRMRRVVKNIKFPWIYHTDGDITLLLDDLLSLGMKGIANIEPPCMDIVDLKRRYGNRLCLIGNIDIGRTLSQGSPQETDLEVKQRIEEIGPGGGYILASSNSITSYCKPENVMALSDAVEKYGHYPVKRT